MSTNVIIYMWKHMSNKLTLEEVHNTDKPLKNYHQTFGLKQRIKASFI